MSRSYHFENLSDTDFLSLVNTTEDCYYEPTDYVSEKFYLVTVFGSTVCLIGFILNCFVVRVLTRSSMIRTHVFYLAVLAVCDIVTEISYLTLMSVQILYDYTGNLILYMAWNNYVKIVFTSTHVSLTIATYMIVSASAERYLASTKFLRSTSCTKRRRWLVTFGVCIFALLSKGLVYFELDVIYKENCTGFGMYVVKPSTMATDPPYRVGYMLWFRHIVHVFFPFILIMCLNGAILSRLKRSPLESVRSALVASTMGQLAKERKKNIKAATMMLGAIATTYLVSNLLNVIITIWEHVDLEYLHDRPRFYTFAADTITLLTVFTSAIRFPIYCACNGQLRREVYRFFKSSYSGSYRFRTIGKRMCLNRERQSDSDESVYMNGETQVTSAA